MTEHEIECRVERKIDALDKRFMGGEVNAHQYEEEIQRITEWAKVEMTKMLTKGRAS